MVISLIISWLRDDYIMSFDLSLENRKGSPELMLKWRNWSLVEKFWKGHRRKEVFFNTKEAKLIIRSQHSGKVKVVLLAESMLTVVSSYASFVGIGYVKYLLVWKANWNKLTNLNVICKSVNKRSQRVSKLKTKWSLLWNCEKSLSYKESRS